MPYGNVGGIQEPGGVLNDVASVYFTAANATAEPYILVNQTNVQKWYYGPFYPYGSVYALQWAIIWDDPVKICDSNPLDLLGTLFFNIDINSPEPKIANVTGQCPQLGAVYEISTASLNSSCSAVVSNNGTGNPCTVTVDQTMVANISSTLRSLVAASTATPSASATTPSSTAKHSIAVGSNVPLSYILATAFIGALQMVM
ncbi:hypothetical protein EYB25_008107 [Talaromyces marneffei]|nr:hypothetical protein EYB25_008107 [Talaromyces marneffei]